MQRILEKVWNLVGWRRWLYLHKFGEWKDCERCAADILGKRFASLRLVNEWLKTVVLKRGIAGPFWVAEFQRSNKKKLSVSLLKTSLLNDFFFTLWVDRKYLMVPQSEKVIKSVAIYKSMRTADLKHIMNFLDPLSFLPLWAWRYQRTLHQPMKLLWKRNNKQ